MMYRLDSQFFPEEDDCERGGIVESLKLTRAHHKGKNLSLVILNLIHRGTHIQGWQSDALRVKHGKPVAVQVTYRPKGCSYGHYLIMFLTKRKAILFDCGGCNYYRQYGKVLNRVLSDNGYSHPLEVWRTRGTNLECSQCSIWMAFGYHIVASQSLSKLRSLLESVPLERQRLFNDFHKNVLHGRPYKPHSRDIPKK